jgi:hypothetical protein
MTSTTSNNAPKVAEQGGSSNNSTTSYQHNPYSMDSGNISPQLGTPMMQPMTPPARSAAHPTAQKLNDGYRKMTTQTPPPQRGSARVVAGNVTTPSTISSSPYGPPCEPGPGIMDTFMLPPAAISSAEASASSVGEAMHTGYWAADVKRSPPMSSMHATLVAQRQQSPAPQHSTQHSSQHSTPQRTPHRTPPMQPQAAPSYMDSPDQMSLAAMHETAMQGECLRQQKRDELAVAEASAQTAKMQLQVALREQQLQEMRQHQQQQYEAEPSYYVSPHQQQEQALADRDNANTYGGYNNYQQQQQQQQPRIPTPLSSDMVLVHSSLRDCLCYVPMPPTAHQPDFDLDHTEPMAMMSAPPAQHRGAPRGAPGSNARSVGMYTNPGFRVHQQAYINGQRTIDLFVAQLPFDMPLSMLQYLATAANLDVEILHAAPHFKECKTYDGCAFVKVVQDHAQAFMQTFHKAALFDVNGVWIAADEGQRRHLARYCQWMQEKPVEERRAMLRRAIPFSAMTAEIAKRSYVF